MLQKPRPVVPTLQDADVARNSSDVDVDQQLLGSSGGGESLPHVPLPEAHRAGYAGKEFTRPRDAEEAMVVVFRLE
jgi:hypothetical protein